MESKQLLLEDALRVAIKDEKEILKLKSCCITLFISNIILVLILIGMLL